MNQQQQQYQQFFFDMGAGRPNNPPRPQNPNLEYNLHILEISNNWDIIVNSYNKYKQGTLKTVNLIQKDCIEFALNNNIMLENYKDSDEFIKLCMKELV